MASLLQAAQQKAAYQAEQQVLGPAFASSLKMFGPPTTTNAFLTYFRNGGKGMTSFFTKDIPSLFSAPFTGGKIIIWGLIFVVLIGIFIYLQTLNKNKAAETFVDTPDNRPNTPNDTDLTKLINIQPQVYKYTGTSNTSENNERTFKNIDKSVLEQLKTGSRFIFVPIDFDSTTTNKDPCLMTRNDIDSNKTNTDSGSLIDLFTSIQRYALNPDVNSTTLPLVIFLHFVRIPYDKTDVEKYIKHLQKVTSMLESSGIINNQIKNHSHSKNEINIFTDAFSSFKDGINQVIIGTNIKTSFFVDNNNVKNIVGSKENLDTYINFHYYTDNRLSGIDNTEPVPTDASYNALIFDYATLKSMTPAQWISKYKKYFTIIKTPSGTDNRLTSLQVKELLEQYGVNVVLYDYAINGNVSNSVKQLYKLPYNIKPEFL